MHILRSSLSFVLAAVWVVRLSVCRWQGCGQVGDQSGTRGGPQEEHERHLWCKLIIVRLFIKMRHESNFYTAMLQYFISSVFCLKLYLMVLFFTDMLIATFDHLSVLKPQFLIWSGLFLISLQKTIVNKVKKPKNDYFYSCLGYSWVWSPSHEDVCDEM